MVSGVGDFGGETSNPEVICIQVNPSPLFVSDIVTSYVCSVSTSVERVSCTTLVLYVEQQNCDSTTQTKNNVILDHLRPSTSH